MAVQPLTSRSWKECFERDGFAILEHVVAPDQAADLIDVMRNSSSAASDGVLDRNGEIYGVRDVLWRVPTVRNLAQSAALLEIVATILGPDAFVVRGLFFDKTLSTNWNLPWHQDLTIAVRARRDVPDFRPWTRKAGIPRSCPGRIPGANADAAPPPRRLWHSQWSDARAPRLAHHG
jgi:hypothetical protein